MAKLMDSREKENNPKREALYSALDSVFNAGWEVFVKQLREENDRCNERLFRVVAAIKGNDFVDELRKFHAEIEEQSLIRVVRKPSGMQITDNRWNFMKTFWIDQRNISGEYHGSICIQVKENRWLKINYAR